MWPHVHAGVGWLVYDLCPVLGAAAGGWGGLKCPCDPHSSSVWVHTHQDTLVRGQIRPSPTYYCPFTHSGWLVHDLCHKGPLLVVRVVYSAHVAHTQQRGGGGSAPQVITALRPTAGSLAHNNSAPSLSLSFPPLSLE
jgi:hypothetical protein